MVFRFDIFLTILFFFATTAFAQDGRSAQSEAFSQRSLLNQISILANIPGNISQLFDQSAKDVFDAAIPSKSARRSSYDKEFYHGLQLIYSNSFVEAGAVFSKLWQDAHSNGYRNLTSYSYVLLDMARRYQSDGRIDEARYLATAAINMSPEDGRVHFAALSLASDKEGPSYWSYLSHGLDLLTRYPSVAFPFFSNVLLVGLTCLTLAFVLTTVVQFALYHRHIHRVLFRKFPRSFQVWIAPILLVAICASSLYFGILPAIIVWSVVLAISLNHARWLAVAACVLTIAWGLGIKVVAVTNENSQLRLNHALENLASGNFVAEDARLLRDSVGTFAYDPYVLFANGVVLYAEGNYSEAKRYFQALLKIAADKKTLSAAAIGNIAVIEFRQANYGEAKAQFAKAQELGVSRFELLRNTSLLSLAEADIVGHRTRYTELKSDFVAQLKNLEVREGEVAQPLLFLVPATSFFKSFFRPPLDDSSRDQIVLREDQLAAALMHQSQPFDLAVFGFIGVCIVLPLALREKLQRFLGLYGAVEPGGKRALLWLPIPGGVWLSGTRPLSGLFILATVLLLLMLHSAVPIPLFTIFPFPLDIGSALPLTAIVIVLVVALSSVVTEFRARSVAQ